MIDAVLVIEAVGAVLIGVAGFFGAALYSRLVGMLDRTAERLEHVATLTAEHGARLNAIERNHG